MKVNFPAAVISAVGLIPRTPSMVGYGGSVLLVCLNITMVAPVQRTWFWFILVNVNLHPPWGKKNDNERINYPQR